jgi:hypothetical protein
MKISRLISLASLINGIVAVSSGMALAQVTHDYRICAGDFALCAASTCTPQEGKTITPNQTTMAFPEAQCTCPIFSGLSIADVVGGNMQGSCQPPAMKHGIWSTYAPKGHIPQAINDWKKHGPAASSPGFVCPGTVGNTISQVTNCFSFACVRAGKINGVRVATCSCPIGEDPDAQPVQPGTPFATQAGQCQDSICSQYPVGAAFKFDDILQPGQCIEPPGGSTDQNQQ